MPALPRTRSLRRRPYSGALPAPLHREQLGYARCLRCRPSHPTLLDCFSGIALDMPGPQLCAPPPVDGGVIEWEMRDNFAGLASVRSREAS